MTDEQIQGMAQSNRGSVGFQEAVVKSPPRTWQGLTDEEREDIATEYGLEWLAYRSAFKEVEAKLKEKNT